MVCGQGPYWLVLLSISAEEYALLEMLDGEASSKISKIILRPVPSSRITVDEVSRFVSTLHRSGLVLVIGQARGLSSMNVDGNACGRNGKTGSGALCVCGFVVSTQTGFSTSSILGLAGCTHRRHSWLLLCTYSQHSC